MTFAETLNQNECSCGVEDGVTFFLSEDGAKAPTEVGDYRIETDVCGALVEHYGEQYLVVGFEKNTDKRVCAVYDNKTRLWTDLTAS